MKRGPRGPGHAQRDGREQQPVLCQPDVDASQVDPSKNDTDA
jgi:hypothetical protein